MYLSTIGGSWMRGEAGTGETFEERPEGKKTKGKL
jgi:hypothetical protein